ncbi:MAG: hypothetical protein GX451_03505, partial [Acholeplasmataceae bacterium]|nr:hypothetical protein [Acholeplasmataceae bacterium]
MFNNYFKSDKNNIEFLFANVTVKNVDFALISLSALLDGENIDYNLYNDEHTFCFFHIQSLLTACGNIYNVFYGFSSKLPSHNNMYRTTLLRNTFGINKSRFPLVFQKEVRNTNEHFDERFDAL